MQVVRSRHPKTQRNKPITSVRKSQRWDLNPQPSHYECDALPIEATLASENRPRTRRRNHSGKNQMNDLALPHSRANNAKVQKKIRFIGKYRQEAHFSEGRFRRLRNHVFCPAIPSVVVCLPSRGAGQSPRRGYFFARTEAFLMTTGSVGTSRISPPRGSGLGEVSTASIRSTTSKPFTTRPKTVYPKPSCEF